MDIKIRNVTPGDERVVLEIFNYFVNNSFAAYTEHPEGSRFFQRLIEISKGYPFYVAENNSGEVVGFALLHPYYGIGVFRRAARITYFIKPECTRHGLGKVFLDNIVVEAMKIGVDIILASISSRNEQSISFHKKHGFVECGRFKDVGIKWGKSFDEVWMQYMVK